MSVRLSEEIPEEPPTDEAERHRLQWMMQRENYRIAKEYDRMTRGVKIVVAVILYLIGAVVSVFTFWEWFKKTVQ